MQSDENTRVLDFPRQHPLQTQRRLSAELSRKRTFRLRPKAADHRDALSFQEGAEKVIY